jgi:3'-phosphoadenosine 5'-phosphosulfate sulfotransferase (PAPS reductase)/FAD synthetase
MKKKPAKKYERETGRHPIIGTMAEESRIRWQRWVRHGCNAYSDSRPSSNPISFWTEQDILEYIKRYELPYAEVYGKIVEQDGKLVTTGCARTGCVFCGFGCHLEKGENRFQRLKRTHPQLWTYCMDKLGMREVLSYIDVPIE